jgi:hypothetical protein
MSATLVKAIGGGAGFAGLPAAVAVRIGAAGASLGGGGAG